MQSAYRTVKTMLKETICTAKTIEEAKTAALQQLGLTEDDDFHYEVLKMPTKKVLGLFGGSDAQVKVSVEVPDPAEKKAPAPKKERPPRPAKAPQEGKAPAKPAQKADRKPGKPAHDAQKPHGEPAKKDDEPAPAPKKADLHPSDAHETTAQYIVSIVKALGVETCTVHAFDNEEEVLFELECGEDYGIVIGRRGETLDAIQYLARTVESHANQSYKRVSINVGNYREKREAALVGLAKRNAAKVLRTGRSIALEPMNPFERRIIHTAIQEVEGVVSYSTGVDFGRRVIIAPEGAPKNARPPKSDYHRGDRRDRHDRPKREPYVPEIPADREKHSDAAGVSRYGKIEVKKDAPETTEE